MVPLEENVRLPAVVMLPDAAIRRVAPEVAIPPIKKSSEIGPGAIEPLFLCHQPWVPVEVPGKTLYAYIVLQAFVEDPMSDSLFPLGVMSPATVSFVFGLVVPRPRLPSLVRTSLAVPEEEATKMLPLVVLLLTISVAVEESFAMTASLSEICTPPPLLFVVFTRAFWMSITPVPSGARVTLVLLPTFVPSTRDLPVSFSSPPVA